MASFIVSAFEKDQGIITLLLIGGFLGVIKHLCNSLWQRLVGAFCLTAHIYHPDEAYSWMMVWLARLHNAGSICTHEVQICTGNWGLTYHKNVAILPGPSTSSTGNADPGSFHKSRLLSYLPAFGVKQWLKYHGTWISIYRTKDLSQSGNRTFQYETIVLSLFTRDWHVLQQLLQEARDLYKSYEEHLVCVYGINKDSFSWMRISEKAKRPLSTIILPSETKTALLNDLKAFLSNESWYIEKGIPYRRGYLLHGVPGSGKSSLIHGIAGELNLSIYMISLSIKDLDDSTLCKMINQVPTRSAIVFEDLDVLSPHAAASRRTLNDNRETTVTQPGSLTLSGLLNALDGLSAQEGRIIFATSNKYHDLDPALRRPGRLDRHFEFYNANKQQHKELFLNFYRHLHNIIPSSSLMSESKDETQTLLVHPVQFNDSAENGATAEKCEKPVDSAELEILSVAFSERILDETFSMAMIQEYLVQYKYQPRAAVCQVDKWVKREMVKLNDTLRAGEKEP